MAGWIKLHRDIMESATFETLMVKQQMIAIKLILKVNYEDGIWTDKKKGIQVPIKRGQIITSPQKIADEWFKNDKDVTRQVVRTTLDRLEKLNFLTKQATNNYTLLTLTNYSVYQDKEDEDNQVSNQVLTKSQPSANLVLTTIKELKELKELSNKKQSKVTPSDRDFEHAHLIYELRAAKIKPPRKPDMTKWANEFRILRKDFADHTDDIVERNIRWSQGGFWASGNIQSAPKFRKRYEEIHLDAEKKMNVLPMFNRKPQHDIHGAIERRKAKQQGVVIEIE